MSVTWNCGVCGAQGFSTSDEKCSDCLSVGGAVDGTRYTPRMGALRFERDLADPAYVKELQASIAQARSGNFADSRVLRVGWMLPRSLQWLWPWWLSRGLSMILWPRTHRALRRLFTDQNQSKDAS